VTSIAFTGERLLEGYTVIDFTRVLAGPYCTRLLADLGARVIKIERPGEGDEIRYTALQLDPGRSDQSSYYARLNTGKEGIAIDLSRPQARELVFDLARAADVVVENFSPGVMTRYGLDATALRAEFPELVVCSISGFGQTGPLASMQAYAHLINAISGMMDLDRGGEAQPRVSYLQAADVLAGTHAFGAICAALLRRARSGQGATLDISMLECLIAADDITYGAILNGAPVERQPRVGMMVHAFGERHIALQTAGAPHLWSRLVALVGKPESWRMIRASPRRRRGARTGVHCNRCIANGWAATAARTKLSPRCLRHACPWCPCCRPKKSSTIRNWPRVRRFRRSRIRVAATYALPPRHSSSTDSPRTRVPPHLT